MILVRRMDSYWGIEVRNIVSQELPIDPFIPVEQNKHFNLKASSNYILSLSDVTVCQYMNSVIGKILENFIYKIEEKYFGPREAVKIRSVLASVYKQKFGRVGAWKVVSGGQTEGSSLNCILIDESMKYYQRKKQEMGFKRSLPLRLNYMKNLWEHTKRRTISPLYACYIMAITSLFFCLWLRIDELVQLKLCHISLDEMN